MLREYQEKAVDEVRDCIKQGLKKPITLSAYRWREVAYSWKDNSTIGREWEKGFMDSPSSQPSFSNAERFKRTLRH